MYLVFFSFHFLGISDEEQSEFLKFASISKAQSNKNSNGKTGKSKITSPKSSVISNEHTKPTHSIPIVSECTPKDDDCFESKSVDEFFEASLDDGVVVKDCVVTAQLKDMALKKHEANSVSKIDTTLPQSSDCLEKKRNCNTKLDYLLEVSLFLFFVFFFFL